MQGIEAVIGLEIHAQLKTSSKIFCRCSTEFGAYPNTQVCPVCLGLPGSLPVLNPRVVELALRVGLAAGCRVSPVSVFARKNYFYPDLPKGYQISQYDRPLCESGEISLLLNGGVKRVRLSRIHLEEDAGKTMHVREDGGDFSLVDFNRCGVPLIEIVSEPDLSSPQEAVAFLEVVKQLLEYLEVCDGDMEKGNLRADCNVSIKRGRTNRLGTGTEIKNLNSFRNIERALAFEIDRQTGVLSEGHEVVRQTLLWDEAQDKCVPMRAKEEAHDYRYFPEPDLPPLTVTEDLLREIESKLPELPWRRRERLAAEYKIPPYDAALLTSTKPMADYYEECVMAGADPKAASNWIMTEVLRALKDSGVGIEAFPVRPAGLAELLNLLRDGIISAGVAKSALDEMIETGDCASDIVARRGLVQVKDKKAIESVAAEILEAEREAVEQYLKGKERALQYLVGNVMTAMGGKADPHLVRDALMRMLARLKEPR